MWRGGGIPVCSGQCSCLARAFVATRLTLALAVGARLIVITLGAMDTARVASSGDLVALRPCRRRREGGAPMLTVSDGRIARESGKHAWR